MRNAAVRTLLTIIVLGAAALRFYGLGWGAPYAHFHIDEHFVFVGAYLLRDGMEAAAGSTKYFMYGPLPGELLNAVLWVYERFRPPLDLTNFHDQVTYMIMGRAVSATLGSATVLVVYFIGKRVAGRAAGLLAAALLATTVIHIAESHSFRVDLTMIFFLSIAWLFAFRIAEDGRWPDYIGAGIFVGAAIVSKFSGAFVLGVIAIAHVFAPQRPSALRPFSRWLLWAAQGLSVLLAAFVTFAASNPMAFLFPRKFRKDIMDHLVDPLSGTTRPLWAAQFTDVQPQLYWLTNLYWGMGPALAICGLLGILLLAMQRTRAAWVAAIFPVLYFLSAGGTTAPMARYALPLAPALAVAAGALSARLLATRRLRIAAVFLTVALVSTTTAYAVAYTNIYRLPDARLAASRYLTKTVPKGAQILVEPAHSTPPTGSYLQNPQFLDDYVLWGPYTENHDYYSLYTLDMYVHLYDRSLSDDDKRAYIKSRLDLVDYIVIDDFYVQLYHHLPASSHAVVRQYYDDLFSGALGFDLVRTFKSYPALGPLKINDDGAELSSRMNDHPRIYIFKRRQPR